MLTYNAVRLHDNARPKTAARTRALLHHFNWELFDHRPYSTDLAPSDYHLLNCTYLKNWLGSQHSNNNKAPMEVVKTWLSSQAENFFDTGIQKLILRYNKCLNSGDDSVEK
jgi:AAA15 family ATPase/GTPase